MLERRDSNELQSTHNVVVRSILVKNNQNPPEENKKLKSTSCVMEKRKSEKSEQYDNFNGQEQDKDNVIVMRHTNTIDYKYLDLIVVN